MRTVSLIVGSISFSWEKIFLFGSLKITFFYVVLFCCKINEFILMYSYNKCFLFLFFSCLYTTGVLPSGTVM